MTIYYTIYQTTNLVNGRIYVGAHKTPSLNDRYLGSNKILHQAIKKYGRKNFVRQILFIFDNEEDMFEKEREIVNEDFINRIDTYNIVEGGRGWTGIGDYTYRKKLGIFSDDFIKNRKSEISRRTHVKLKRESLGIYGIPIEKRRFLGKQLAEHCRSHKKGAIFGATPEERTLRGKRGSQTCRERQIGLFGLTFEERSRISKQTQANRCPEERAQTCSKGGKIGGRKGVENKSGVHGLTAEQRSENAKKANAKLREQGKGFFDRDVQAELGRRGGAKIAELYSGYFWYHDLDKKEYWYTPEDQSAMTFEDFLAANPQFKAGRPEREYKPRPKMAGKRTLTNGTANIMIPEADCDAFLQENPDYRYGRTNFKKREKR